MSNEKMILYDKYCKQVNCKEYIEWECDVDTDDGVQGYPCISCMKQGQSYNIITIAPDCIHKKEIQKLNE